MITAIAWITFVFIMAQFLVLLANILWYERMIREDEAGNSKVSVLIPARNEESNISNILEDVLNQEHKNIEVIVFDDQSEDRTAAIVRSHIDQDKRVQLIRSDSLPEGWMGKTHACYNLAGAATGEYLLFLDADVRISGDIIPRSIAHAAKYGLSLVSLFPKQIMKGFGEKISIPVMNYILLTLLPLILVRTSKRASLAAANGQYMFFEAGVYRDLQPHLALKDNKVEDIAIARWYKEKGKRISCLTGDKGIMCRMYQNYHEALKGFSKNILEFFGGSAAIAITYWLLTSLGMIFVILGLSLELILVFFTIYLLGRILVSIRSNQSIMMNLAFLLPQQVSMGVFIFNAIRYRRGKKLKWKGRNI